MHIYADTPDDSRFRDLAGQTIGAYFVCGYAGVDGHNMNHAWFCRCLCGKITRVRTALLIAGRAKCCGAAGCRSRMHAGEVCRDRSAAGISALRLQQAALSKLRGKLEQTDPEWSAAHRVVVRIPEEGSGVLTVISYPKTHQTIGRSTPTTIDVPFSLTACPTPEAALAQAHLAGLAAAELLLAAGAAR